MQLASSYEWVVADDVGVAVSSSENIVAWTAFVDRFELWLAETHPDAAGEVEFLRLCGTTFFPAAQDVPTALESIDELAASRR